MIVIYSKRHKLYIYEKNIPCYYNCLLYFNMQLCSSLISQEGITADNLADIYTEYPSW